MRKALGILAATALLGLASCVHGPTPPPPPGGFTTFSDFLKQTTEARFADYAKREGAEVRDEAAFEEMRAHIRTMYEGVKPVHSFFVDGRYCDCITVESQPSLRLQGLKAIEKAPRVGGGPPE